ERIKEMAKELDKDYADKKPIFLAILNGSFMFTADLFKNIQGAVQITFVKFNSYSGTQSTGHIKESIGLNEDIKGRHVVILEDIVDTVKSLHYFLPLIEKELPASIALAVLLYKPTAIEYPLSIKYLGFEIEDKFVVGYGLDYDGWGRNLPQIYQLKEE